MTPSEKQALRALCEKATCLPGYEVTADGRVFSVDSNWRGLGQRELKQFPNRDGYPSVRINGKRYSVHRLVITALVGPQPSPDHQVRHLDGNKNNNHVSNLAWGTAKENADDRELHGTTARGARNGVHTHPERRATGDRQGLRRHPERTNNAKLNLDVVAEIKRRLADGESQSAIGRSLGIHPSNINRIANGKAWRVASAQKAGNP